MSPILVDYMGNFARGPAGPRGVARPAHGPHAVAGAWRFVWLVAVVSLVFMCWCLRHAAGTHVASAPAREVSMLFAALIGGHLLARRPGWRICGAVCIAAGVTALALG